VAALDSEIVLQHPATGASRSITGPVPRPSRGDGGRVSNVRCRCYLVRQRPARKGVLLVLDRVVVSSLPAELTLLHFDALFVFACYNGAICYTAGLLCLCVHIFISLSKSQAFFPIHV
jgi:hypothetical protein